MNRRETKLYNRARQLTQEFRGVIFNFLTREGVKEVKFNDKTGNFEVHGKAVPLKEIQRLLLQIDTRVSKKIEQYVARLQSGEWDLIRWREEMIALLEESHVLVTALALGGLALAAQDTFTETLIQRQINYLGKFVRDIEIGKLPITSGRIRSRARSYTRALRITYSRHSLTLHRKLGYKEAMRILTAHESCVDTEGIPGCLGLGGVWTPIMLMRPIGTAACGHWCVCYLVFR